MRRILPSGFQTILFALGMLGAFSCTVTYSTRDINKSLHQTGYATNQVILDLQTKRREMDFLQKDLLSQIADPLLAPYPELDQQLNSLRNLETALDDEKSNLDEISARIRSLTRGKKKIDARSATWKEIRTLRKEYKTHLSRVNGQIDLLNQSFKSLESFMQRSGISMIKTDDAIGSIQQYLDQLQEAIKDQYAQIDQARTQLASAGNRALKPAERQGKVEILDSMTLLVDDLDHGGTRMNALLKELQT